MNSIWDVFLGGLQVQINYLLDLKCFLNKMLELEGFGIELIFVIRRIAEKQGQPPLFPFLTGD